jgi:hypothetical protein
VLADKETRGVGDGQWRNTMQLAAGAGLLIVEGEAEGTFCNQQVRKAESITHIRFRTQECCTLMTSQRLLAGIVDYRGDIPQVWLELLFENRQRQMTVSTQWSSQS